MIFSYLDRVSFFGIVGQEITVLCFSDSFVQTRSPQSDDSGNFTTIFQISCNLFKKLSFFSANTYKNNNASKCYCVVHHVDKRCFLAKRRYHLIKRGDIKHLLQNLDAFFFNYQHKDCLYAPPKYRFSDKIAAKSGQIFDIVQRAVYFHQVNETSGQNAQPREPKTIEKKVQKMFSRLLW